MLWAIFVIILALWILGFSLHVAGSMIHLLLVVAVNLNQWIGGSGEANAPSIG